MQGKKKSPILALGLSVIVPGLGQWYGGDRLRGLVILGGTILIQFVGLFAMAVFESVAGMAGTSLEEWVLMKPYFLRFGVNGLDILWVLGWVLTAWILVAVDAYIMVRDREASKMREKVRN